MNDSANLYVYFILVFGIVAMPGLDMAFVMGSSLIGGLRSGFAAVGGIVAGGFCHVAMAACGVAAILTLWAPLFTLMLAAGAVYIAWMGWSMFRSSSRPDGGAAGPQPARSGSSVGPPAGAGQACAPATTFRRAMLTNLLNPKAYLFMLAIFPQFLRPAQGPVWIQATQLGAITSLTQAGVYGALALVAARAGQRLGGNPSASLAAARIMGLLLMGVAGVTALHILGAHD